MRSQLDSTACSIGATLATRAWLVEDESHAGTTMLIGTSIHAAPLVQNAGI